MAEADSKSSTRRRKRFNQVERLYVLSLRDPKQAMVAYAKMVGSKIDVQAVVEAFEQKVEDAICFGDGTIELSAEFAETVAVLLKSVKRPAFKPRTSRPDRITQKAAVAYARALMAQGATADRAAHRAADKVKGRLKKFSAGTIRDLMSRGPRGGGK
jgi:hypothetical protein